MTNVPHSFLLNKPKDIVSGDFFWSKKIGHRVFFAVADCTGHGVPGAMVSIVCYQTLDEVIVHNPHAELGVILNIVQQKIQELFSASESRSINDGMDISLCAHKINSNKLSFSGANNSIYRVTNIDDSTQYSAKDVTNENFRLIEYKASKQGIGKLENALKFETVDIEFLDGDFFYLTSDGFQDQFGGTRNKKMTKKRMKAHFLQNVVLPMYQMEPNLNGVFNEWKGSQEQVDDVLVVGIRLHSNMT